MNILLQSKAMSSTNKTTDKEITKVINTYFNYINKNSENKSSIQFIVSNPQITKNKTTSKKTINVFYYVAVNNVKENDAMNSAMVQMGNTLSKMYTEEISLNFTRIYYPYINASIFSKFLFHNSNANTFLDFQNIILKYCHFTSSNGITGIKVQVAGRLSTEKVIPRVTKKSMVFGSLSNSNFVDFGMYTGKNYLGSFTIKVWIGIK